MRNIKVLTIGLMVLTYMAYFGDVSFSQVLGNGVSQGMRLGQHASRGSNTLSRFTNYSTGVANVTQTVTRTTPDPLFVRMKANLRSSTLGTVGAKPRSRPTNTGILRPTRPTVYNGLLQSTATMLSVGNMPRSRIFNVERSMGPLRPIRGKSTLFTIKPQELLRPDLQQRNSVGLGLLRRQLSMAQQHTVTHQTALTRNVLTSQQTQLSRKPTIFDIGLRLQNQRRAPMSIFNVR